MKTALFMTAHAGHGATTHVPPKPHNPGPQAVPGRCYTSALFANVNVL